MTKLTEIGERELINRFREIVSTNDSVVDGIGDDCAVVRTDQDTASDMVLTSDALLEGVHFMPEALPSDIGHKAVARALSDLAAMGAHPMWALINLVAPSNCETDKLAQILACADRTAMTHGAAIVGGDTTCGNTLELHVFAVGQLPSGSALLRSGAQAGDSIYVTDTLGSSGAGKHLAFEPRIAQGIWLREGDWATSMIDISDGLVVDLMHIAEASKVGAILSEDAIPVSSEALAATDGLSPLEHALSDGEDYELLFTVPAEKQAAIETSWPKTFDLRLTRVGSVTKDVGTVQCTSGNGQTRDLDLRGYEHFRADQ